MNLTILWAFETFQSLALRNRTSVSVGLPWCIFWRLQDKLKDQTEISQAHVQNHASMQIKHNFSCLVKLNQKGRN